MITLYVMVEGDKTVSYKDIECKVEAPFEFDDLNLSEALNFKMTVQNAYRIVFERRVSAEWDFERKGRELSEKDVKTVIEKYNETKNKEN